MYRQTEGKTWNILLIKGFEIIASYGCRFTTPSSLWSLSYIVLLCIVHFICEQNGTVLDSVSQPCKGHGAPDNYIVGTPLISRVKIQILASNIVDFKILGSTSRLFAEHLWSPEQWLGATGLKQDLSEPQHVFAFTT